MPELPEVEALAMFVAEQGGGHHGRAGRARVAVGAEDLRGHPSMLWSARSVVGAERRGKYLCIDSRWTVAGDAPGPGWLAALARSRPPARARPGKGPLALRVGLSNGAGFDLTEQGTEKRLALWLVERPGDHRRGSAARA